MLYKPFAISSHTVLHAFDTKTDSHQQKRRKIAAGIGHFDLSMYPLTPYFGPEVYALSAALVLKIHISTH